MTTRRTENIGATDAIGSGLRSTPTGLFWSNHRDDRLLGMIAIRSRWRSGSATGTEGGLVSATRTVVHRYRDLPGILRGGSRLLRHWDEHEGGIGVQVAVDLVRRTSWTVSLWTSEAALTRFVRSDRHQVTIGPYRSRVTVSSITFFVDDFDLREAWAEAASRLRDAPRRPCRRADR